MESLNKTLSLLLGEVGLYELAAYFILSIVGATAHWLLIFLNRKANVNENPQKFDFVFLLQDNLARLFFTLICVYLWARGGEYLTAIWPSLKEYEQAGILIYFAIGFGNHYIVSESWKRFKMWKKKKSNASKG